VVRFMVQVTDPRLGETVLDPACGTGGFLVEAYDHIAQQVTTPDQRRTLQRDTLFGQEAKPLPYMLAQMNLLLHGLEYPQIAYGNTLERRITEIGHSERVDVILTNPPFGGEEEAGIKANFPANMQTAETALLFLQYIMRKLRYAGHGAEQGRPRRRRRAQRHPVRRWRVCRHQGGDAQGVPTCTPSCACQGRVRALHRHPGQPAVLQRGGPTDDIWYYELPCPKAARSTARPRRCPSRPFSQYSTGGTSARKARKPGAWTSLPSTPPPSRPPHRTGSEPRPNAPAPWRWASRSVSWTRP
jgi:type I restriction enzyme M protein